MRHVETMRGNRSQEAAQVSLCLHQLHRSSQAMRKGKVKGSVQNFDKQQCKILTNSNAKFKHYTARAQA